SPLRSLRRILRLGPGAAGGEAVPDAVRAARRRRARRRDPRGARGRRHDPEALRQRHPAGAGRVLRRHLRRQAGLRADRLRRRIPLASAGGDHPPRSRALPPGRADGRRELLMKTVRTDVLIIGTGFGAAAPALRLAQAGFKVTMIEKGPRVQTADFRQTSDPKYLLKYLRGTPGDHLSLTYAEARWAAGRGSTRWSPCGRRPSHSTRWTRRAADSGRKGWTVRRSTPT